MVERLERWLASTEPERREVIIANVFLLLLLVTGTLGYVAIEGWTWQDGLYMTFITLTTIGFQEVGDLSNAGRFFTIGIGVIGIGIVAFIAARSAQLLFTNQRIRERHLMRQIERMDDHYIVCGYGRTGQRIVDDLRAAGRDVVVVDRDEQIVEALKERQIPHIDADAEEEDTLRAAGLERARYLVLALPEDSANVFVTLTAREVVQRGEGRLRILARANDLRNRRKLLTAGADKVISPDETGADRMAQVILRPHVDQFMEQVLGAGALGLQMEEVRIEPGASLAGRSLAESKFRQEFDAIVVAVLRAETGEMRFNPEATTQLAADDVLIVLGSPDMIQRLREGGCRRME